jgi:hypothetical protein
LECAEIRLTFASSIRANKTSERQQKENLKLKIVLTIKKLRKEKNYGKDSSFNEDSGLQGS